MTNSCIFSPHRDLLSRISFYNPHTARYPDSNVSVRTTSSTDGRFITYSKEGAVAFWDTKMSLLKSYHVSKGSIVLTKIVLLQNGCCFWGPFLGLTPKITKTSPQHAKERRGPFL